MARYIDVNRDSFPALHQKELNDYMKGWNTCLKSVLQQPTADVQEVQHAKWEINSDGYYPYCSLCKTEPKNGVMSKYCPECGATMNVTDITVGSK